jgi:hypothetical protein
MGHGNLLVERRKRAEERAFGIALDNAHVEALRCHHGIELRAALGAELLQRTAFALEPDVGLDIEAAQDLLRHVGMLAGVDPPDVGPVLRFQLMVDGRELDDLGPGAADKGDD